MLTDFLLYHVPRPPLSSGSGSCYLTATVFLECGCDNGTAPTSFKSLLFAVIQRERLVAAIKQVGRRREQKEDLPSICTSIHKSHIPIVANNKDATIGGQQPTASSQRQECTQQNLVWYTNDRYLNFAGLVHPMFHCTRSCSCPWLNCVAPVSNRSEASIELPYSRNRSC